jgi:hypothetical protein
MRPREEEVTVEPGMVASSPSEGLLMSSLARGNRLFPEQKEKSMRMSMKLGDLGVESDADQALRRYDFTRSSTINRFDLLPDARARFNGGIDSFRESRAES